MAWDTPSVNRGRRAPGPARAAAPVKPVGFGTILGRIAATLLVGVAFGWIATWLGPAIGISPTRERVFELAIGVGGVGLAIWLQSRPRRHGLPQRVLDRADRPWSGGYGGGPASADDDVTDGIVAEGVVEVVVDLIGDIVSD